ncbi:MAG: hypothetical protein WBL67_12550, partial [Nitrososphaeraceae archaeon]
MGKQVVILSSGHSGNHPKENGNLLPKKESMILLNEFQSTTLIKKGPCSLSENPSVESHRKSTEKTRADGD